MQQVDFEKKKWSIIYPVYLNAKKTAAEGRKVAKPKAVDNPTAQEIHDVCKHLGFQCELEADKAYPRDFLQKGRVRVLLKDNGKPTHAELTSKKVLLIKLGELIPKLQSRQGGAGQGGGSTSGGKGGKGKRRGR